MQDRLTFEDLFDQLLQDQLELNEDLTVVKNQLTTDKLFLQNVIAKLNNEVHLLLSKLKESEKVRFSFN